MGSVGASTLTAKQPERTRTERLVNLIGDIVGGWIEDSYIDDDEKETIENWHDLLEHLSMEASEAKEDIIEDLWDRAGTWNFSYSKRNIPEEDTKLIFLDNEFEDENGNFMKYGEVMKLVKQELVKRGYMQKPY